ncbi:fimbrial biogenesis outer membrane usher protein [Morganella psychrotolerans]|uniref:Fimbrial biogenesis outer membrane usher protein n=2 Tax=Morganella psychrotolerans TaxID=368603 RepID=A0A5M9R446_9GAMM|nr:fimbria/pilus outer membrane usher protein [Morganella psychrotolerans]KAA8714215.1 fimbrial biogenesis outer membrane usher protein [Morganella psychrotolerans]
MKNTYNKNNFILLPVISFLLAGTSCSVIAGDYYPPGLFSIAGAESQLTNEELDVFKENDVAPGKYKVNLFINNSKISNQDIDFILMKNSSGSEKLAPCFSKADWDNFGIEFPVLPDETQNTDNCLNINNIEFVQGYLDLNTKVYSLTVPQSYINKDKLSLIEEKNWDNGIPVLFVDYLFSAFNRQHNGNSDDNYYGNIRTRVNMGAWRYKNYSTWMNDTNGKKKWNNISNTLSRNINKIKSEFTIGDLYSSSQLFDSVKYRGVRLTTDRTMEPTNKTNYVPTISGLANSEATVTIVQNGETILRQSVPAGPFNLTNYFPMSNGGNLYVNVTETDGSEKNFIVPFSSISTLERKGNIRYSLSSGKYDSRNDGDGKYINQAEVFYGFTDFITLYGGAFVAPRYQSGGIGAAFNLGVFGAITTDILHAKTTMTDDKKFSGNAFRVNYSKRLEATNTSLSLVGYRHFDTNFYRFDDAMAYQDNNNSHNKLKNEYTLSLNQPILSGNSSLNISSVIYEYTNGKKQKSYNAGFNSSFNKINYGIYYNYYQGGKSHDNNKNTYNISMNLSVPLSINDYPVWANYSASVDNDRQSLQTAGISGNYGDKQQGSWDIYQSHGNKGVDYSGGLSSSYRSQYSTVHAGYSYSKDNKNLSYGMNGSLVATQYGVLATPALQETNALVLTKDAAGIGVVNGHSLKTNNSGLAIVSGMTPYRKNNITIDTQTLPGNVEIENNIINNIVPTKGALILANFDAKKGYKLLIKLTSKDNTEIPLGAKASMEGSPDYLVSNFSSLYFVANKEKGDIFVEWKYNGVTQHCRVNYNINNTIPTNGLYIMTSDCQQEVL